MVGSGSGARRIAAALGAFAFLSLGALARQSDYGEAVQRFRATHGLEKAGEGEASVEAALTTVFAAVDVGWFEVRYPWTQLADPKRCEELRDLLLGLVDLQLRVRAWLDVEKAEPSPPEEAAALRAWIKGWRGDAMKKAVAGRKPDEALPDVLGINAATRGALDRFRDSFRAGTAFGIDLKGAKTRLVLAPTRDHFVGFVAWVGAAKDDWKQLAWSANLPQRVEFHVNDMIVLALTSPAPDGNGAGIAMDTREKSGLLQHVAQYSADRSLKHLFGATLDTTLHSGLAVDLVIELCGENNARLFGNTDGNSIAARERFVPGGRSEGGKLAARSADSRWRAEKGKDYFVKQLKLAQTEGGKVAKSLGESAPAPWAHFILDASDKPNVKDIAHAPALGAFAASQQIPANFFADFQEFLRAYRACFVWWLANEAKAADGGRRGVAQLLRARLAKPDASLDELATQAFGVPLATATPDTKSLEWQFLVWLSKVRD